LNEVKDNAVVRMHKSIDSLKLDLSKIRTGRAHAGILDHLSVDYYGAKTLLTQLANITVADATTLNIQPYEKNMIQAIEKVIRESDMGLNPATSGELIRIPMPALTEERRKDLIKVVRSEGENSKISIRNIRRDCNDVLKKMSKEKEISEDDEKRMQEEIQKITDQSIIEVDRLVDAKEKDLLVI
jgi:ribosome recycling factor